MTTIIDHCTVCIFVGDKQKTLLQLHTIATRTLH